jgi:hypothetical protein
MNFIFVTYPSVKPLLIVQVRPFFTASLSFSIPRAVDWSSRILLWFTSANQLAIEAHTSPLAEHLGELLYQLLGSILFPANP